MAECQLAVDDAIHAVLVADHAVVVGVMRQRLAALHDEVEHGLPGAGVQLGKGMRGADFGKQRIGVETTAQGQGHAMLREHVERKARRGPRFDLARLQRLARGGVFDQL